jgi:hypothetical protein
MNLCQYKNTDNSYNKIMTKRSICTLYLSPEDQELLAEKAAALGLIRGNKPNISELVRRLARGTLPAGESLSDDLQRALIALLWQTRDVGAGLLFAHFLDDRGDVLPEIKRQVGLFLEPLQASWVPIVGEFIKEKRSFELFYSDAAGQPFTFNVRFAEFVQREKRTYLDCWCEQAEGNHDLPGLKHNWSFRPDRIASAGVVAIDAQWRTEGLDEIAAEFHLFDGLAHAYEPRAEDLKWEWISSDPRTLEVQRRITSSFWFLREVLPYGANCKVLGNEDLRQLIVKEVEALRKIYE